MQRASFASLVSLCLLLSPLSLRAQDADPQDETLITVWGDKPRPFDVIQGTNVLRGDKLERDLSRTLGETLDREPGVHNTYFGPGAGRPVIRGFSGGRIRVLNNGVGTLDASVVSPDHATGGEPMTAEKIEVVRGAGTLRYGTSAIGGVVNVIDGRIPTALPEGGIDFEARAGYAGNANERFLGGGGTLGVGHLAVHGEGFIRDTDDIAALRDVANTDIDENRGGSGGASLVWDRGHAGFAYSRLDNNYGILDAAPGASEEVRIDLEQERYDVSGDWRRDLWLFDQMNLRGAYAEYEHSEIEDGEVGTTFERFAWEGRLELQQKTWKDFSGLWGFQFETGNFRAAGEEGFLPRTNTLKTGLFTIQQRPLGPFDLEAGFRWERVSHDPRELTLGNGTPRADDATFNTFSFSLGGSWSSEDENYLLGLSLSRTERAPGVEELFSAGPHLATAGFEIGDPSLDKEVGIGVELTARKRAGRLTGGANLYYTTFDDYIFLRFRGDEEDGLPVRLYDQRDAEIWGAELELGFVAYEAGALRGLFDFTFDYVRGELGSGDNLPRIAPWSVRLGAEAQSSYLDARIEVEYVGKQEDTAAFEFATKDFARLNASLVLRPFGDGHDLSVLLEGRNLTNSLARSHVSFLKDVLPMPGRDVRVSVRYAF